MRPRPPSPRALEVVKSVAVVPAESLRPVLRQQVTARRCVGRRGVHGDDRQHDRPGRTAEGCGAARRNRNRFGHSTTDRYQNANVQNVMTMGVAWPATPTSDTRPRAISDPRSTRADGENRAIARARRQRAEKQQAPGEAGEAAENAELRHLLPEPVLRVVGRDVETERSGVVVHQGQKASDADPRPRVLPNHHRCGAAITEAIGELAQRFLYRQIADTGDEAEAAARDDRSRGRPANDEEHEAQGRDRNDQPGTAVSTSGFDRSSAAAPPLPRLIDNGNQSDRQRDESGSRPGHVNADERQRESAGADDERCRAPEKAERRARNAGPHIAASMPNAFASISVPAARPMCGQLWPLRNVEIDESLIDADDAGEAQRRPPAAPPLPR